MNRYRRLPFLLAIACATASAALGQISINPVSRFSPGQGSTACEISAFDPQTARLFVINGATNAVDVVSLANVLDPELLFSIDLTSYGFPNSVAVRNGVVAVAVANAVKTSPGKVVLTDASGSVLSSVTVGALPDMLTFSHNGRYLVVANEGEPNSYNQPDSVDPEGSISVIDMSSGAANLEQSDVRTAGFGGYGIAMLPPSVRIFGPNATVAQDMEPEYVAISQDSKTAYVTCQENNAMAVVDLNSAKVTAVKGLGFKDHSAAGNALDPSDRDGAANGPSIKIGTWPVYGIYMPDAIDSYQHQGETFLVMANEGDARDYTGFAEEARVNGLSLDSTAFPNGNTLKLNANLGRLTVTRTLGDTDGDGDFDRLFAFGGRSVTIRRTDGSIVWDSGQYMEDTIAALFSTLFNSDGTSSSFDTRSDNKGPEPEGVILGKAFGRTYAFVGLERAGGVMVYDVTNPNAPTFTSYVNFPSLGDRGPEGVAFVKAEDSPSGLPLLVVSNEVSGSVSIYQITKN